VLNSRSMSVGPQRTFKAFVGQSHVHKSTLVRIYDSSQRAANKLTGPEDSPNATTSLIPSKTIQRLAGNPGYYGFSVRKREDFGVYTRLSSTSPNFLMRGNSISDRPTANWRQAHIKDSLSNPVNFASFSTFRNLDRMPAFCGL
jgi:hypothetical protein